MADELDPHLAERLAETRDVANFSRRAAPSAGADVERSYALPDHLGGRSIQDSFRRSRPAPPVAPEAQPRGLEPHLKARLAEVQDQLTRGTGPLDGVESYRRLRRQLGGGPQ